MTVEVIGKDETKYKYVSCHNCASKLRFTLADRIPHKDYSGGSGWHIKCPICNIDLVIG